MSVSDYDSFPLYSLTTHFAIHMNIREGGFYRALDGLKTDHQIEYLIMDISCVSAVFDACGLVSGTVAVISQFGQLGVKPTLIEYASVKLHDVFFLFAV